MDDMDEITEKLDDIKELLKEILEQSGAVREELEEIKGYGLNNSLSDVCDKIEGIHDSMTDLKSE